VHGSVVFPPRIGVRSSRRRNPRLHRRNPRPQSPTLVPRSLAPAPCAHDGRRPSMVGGISGHGKRDSFHICCVCEIRGSHGPIPYLVIPLILTLHPPPRALGSDPAPLHPHRSSVPQTHRRSSSPIGATSVRYAAPCREKGAGVGNIRPPPPLPSLAISRPPAPPPTPSSTSTGFPILSTADLLPRSSFSPPPPSPGPLSHHHRRPQVLRK
jgi:hypothetical protein